MGLKDENLAPLHRLPKVSLGGNGEAPEISQETNLTAEKILEPRRHLRRSVSDLINTMDDHSVRFMPMQAALIESVQGVMGKLMLAESLTHKALGAKLVLSAQRYNLAMWELTDKQARLDEGMATDIQEHRVFTVEFDK